MSRVRSESWEILAGIVLARSVLGGYSIEWHGRYIGWIHASVGNQWNAYFRSGIPGEQGRYLGTFTQLVAVRRIAAEAGWTD